MLCCAVLGGVLQDVCPAGLRADGSGLLVSVSRGVSGKAALGAGAMAAECRRLRDQINALRQVRVARGGNRSSSSSTTSPAGGPAAGETEVTVPVAEKLKPYQHEFISYTISQKVLRFGMFTLKSGRHSPYFFNAGLFCNGSSLNAVGRYETLPVGCAIQMPHFWPYKPLFFYFPCCFFWVVTLHALLRLSVLVGAMRRLFGTLGSSSTCYSGRPTRASRSPPRWP
jgi:hypothetical protein